MARGDRVLAQAKAWMTAWRDLSLPFPAVAVFLALLDLGPETLHDSRIVVDQPHCIGVFHQENHSEGNAL
jgi:hypothetical protein